MKSSRKLLTVLLALGLLLSLVACSSAGDKGTTETPAEDSTAGQTEETTDVEPEIDPAGYYSLVNGVYNWGSNYDKVVLPKDSDDMTSDEYTVSVWRYDVNGDLLNHGERNVEKVYVSDKEGNEVSSGDYITLELEVIQSDALGSPYYTNPDSFKGQLKDWATCHYTITDTTSGEIYNQLDTVYKPDEQAYGANSFTSGDITMSYACYEPESDGEKHPLIVWLHGAGSGGTDLGFVTGGMLVTNFITEETQETFGGAYVLLPQCPTWWLDDGSESNYTSDGSSIYAEPLMELIESYVSANADIDTSRIYVIGCSNGGYMTIKLALDNPDYFAAGVPVCEAYEDAWLSDEDITTLTKTPLWFVHSEDDPVVDITATAIPTYERLVEAGDENVHFTKYEKIVDPDFGGDYVGHFAWVYALKGMCDTDYDGSAVTVNGTSVNLFQWMAAQSK